jgi:hypothetical protein
VRWHSAGKTGGRTGDTTGQRLGNSLNLGCKRAGKVGARPPIFDHIDHDTNRSGCGFSTKLDVERTCRGASVAGLPGRDSAACQRDEQNSRNKLENDWSQYNAAQRNACDALLPPAAHQVMWNC